MIILHSHTHLNNFVKHKTSTFQGHFDFCTHKTSLWDVLLGVA